MQLKYFLNSNKMFLLLMVITCGAFLVRINLQDTNSYSAMFSRSPKHGATPHFEEIEIENFGQASIASGVEQEEFSLKSMRPVTKGSKGSSVSRSRNADAKAVYSRAYAGSIGRSLKISHPGPMIASRRGPEVRHFKQ